MGGLPPGGKPGGTMNYKSSMAVADAFGRDNLWGKGMQYQADAWKKYDDTQAAKKKSGEAKVRKEPLKNIPDKKIMHRGKDYRTASRIQTSGITKRPKASRANLGSRVAALLKPKTDKKKTEDKLG
tara:strand:+ start:529 stop:906 length:378 start_codon:yes stop_codon:yes gene_type:complete